MADGLARLEDILSVYHLTISSNLDIADPSLYVACSTVLPTLYSNYCFAAMTILWHWWTSGPMADANEDGRSSAMCSKIRQLIIATPSQSQQSANTPSNCQCHGPANCPSLFFSTKRMPTSVADSVEMRTFPR